MQFAADLHLHSRYSGAVSPAMTLENVALSARRKGMNLMGTGDCLQPVWLRDLETKLIETGSGVFELDPVRDEAVLRQLPGPMQTPLRFVLSTEVHCAPAGTPDLGGVHHLIYFRSFAAVRAMQHRLGAFGLLEEGRPRLALTSRQLLEIVLEQGDECRFAPAHVFNPFFSVFGTLSGRPLLGETFGELASKVRLAETGLTSTPAMCRRLASLDGAALFSCSDAHSLENIGREYTVLEAEPAFDAIFNALQGVGPGRVVKTVKYPIERTRYFRNRCLECKRSFDGKRCPVCDGALVMGARDRLEVIAHRAQPVFRDDEPRGQMLAPLRDVIAELSGASRDAGGVKERYFRLLDEIGSERSILTEAPEEVLAPVTTIPLARVIVAQRTKPPGLMKVTVAPEVNQLSLFDQPADGAIAGNTIKAVQTDDDAE